MSGAERKRRRDELRAVTDRLIAEYAGHLPAGSVMRTVARCTAQATHLDVRDTRSVEESARTRLHNVVPAHARS